MNNQQGFLILVDPVNRSNLKIFAAIRGYFLFGYIKNAENVFESLFSIDLTLNGEIFDCSPKSFAINANGLYYEFVCPTNSTKSQWLKEIQTFRKHETFGSLDIKTTTNDSLHTNAEREIMEAVREIVSGNKGDNTLSSKFFITI